MAAVAEDPACLGLAGSRIRFCEATAGSLYTTPGSSSDSITPPNPNAGCAQNAVSCPYDKITYRDHSTTMCFSSFIYFGLDWSERLVGFRESTSSRLVAEDIVEYFCWHGYYMVIPYHI